MNNNILKHLKRITKHKIYVCYFCFKAKLYWQGIVHDLSKYSYTELSESIKYYSDKRSPIEEAKDKTGMSQAWLHHKGRNPHHYEYWTDNYDNGTTTIKMPFKYAVELICDYLAAAKVYNNGILDYRAEYEWWSKKKWNIIMHPNTKNFVTRVLYIMKTENSCDILSDTESLKYIYSYDDI